MSTVAVFWDRDDTLIKDPGYISEPGQVELLPGAAEALKRVSAAGFDNVIITNQSGIARGMFDETTLERIHDRLVALFAEQGATVDAVYYCPYLDGEEAKVEKYRQDSDLRKPKPGMILQASMERKIDLAGSWMVGDSLHDAQAGRAAGCRTVLIYNLAKGERPRKGVDADFVADSVGEAADIVVRYTRTTGPGTSGGAGTTGDSGGAGRAPGSVGSESAGVGHDSAAILQEILTFLRNVDRRRRAEEFSLAKLVGAMLQLLAIGAAIWAVFGWIRANEWGDQMLILVRLQFATLLQVAALTCFAVSPKK